MTQLPGWSYGGEIADADDLSELEAALHTGRVSAAELGYTGEPEISTEPLMVTSAAGEPLTFRTQAEAEAAGLSFEATGIRYRMVWAPE